MVIVAAKLREEIDTDHEKRSGDEALLYGQFHAQVNAAGVPDGGKAAKQGIVKGMGCPEHGQAGWDGRPLHHAALLDGQVISDVNEALRHVLDIAGNQDVIFIGGSTFVVAEINDL